MSIGRIFNTYEQHSVFKEAISYDLYVGSEALDLSDYKISETLESDLTTWLIAPTITEDNLVSPATSDHAFVHVSTFNCGTLTFFNELKVQFYTTAGPGFHAAKVLFLLVERDVAGGIRKCEITPVGVNMDSGGFCRNTLPGWYIREGSLSLYLGVWETGSNLTLASIETAVRVIQ